MKKTLKIINYLFFIVLAITLFTACGDGGSDSDNGSNSINFPVILSVTFSPNPSLVGEMTAVVVTAEDPEGDLLTYSFDLVSRPAGSAVALSVSVNTASFIPDVTGTYDIMCSVSDGVNEVSETRSIFVDRINNAPTISKIIYSPNTLLAGEETLVVMTAEDPEGDHLTYSFDLVSGPSGSTVELSVSDNTASFTPDVTGTYDIMCVVSDGVNEVSETRSIFVGRINNAPTISEMTYSPNPSLFGKMIAVVVTAVDPEGDPLTYRFYLVSKPAGSAVALLVSDNTASFFPNVTGTYDIRCSVSDGVYEVSETKSIFVGRINNAPIISEMTYSPNPSLVGEKIAIVVTAGDPEGDPLTYRFDLVSGPAGSAVALLVSDNTASFFPNVTGTYDIRCSVSDGVYEVSETRSIFVGRINNAPTISAMTYSPNQSLVGENIAIVVTAEDPERDPLTYLFDLVSRPAGSAVSLSVSDNSASFTPDVTGTYDIRCSVSDGVNEVSETRSIFVGRINNAPTISEIVYSPNTLLVGEKTLVVMTAEDPEGDLLTYSFDLVSRPAGSAVSLSVSDNTASFTSDLTGTYEIRCTVSDGVNEVSETRSILIGRINNAPTISGMTYSPDTLFIGEKISVVVTAVDQDADLLTYRFDLVSTPAGSAVALAVSGNTASFTSDLIGTYDIRCTVSDGVNEVSETESIFLAIKSTSSFERILKPNDSFISSFVSGDYLYAVCEQSGLKIFYMSDNLNLHFLSSLDTDGTASGVYVSGNYAYIADGSSGLKVVDVTDKSAPVLIGSLDTDGIASGIHVSAYYAYIADGDRGLKIINVANKSAPVLEGSIDTDGFAYGISMSIGYAYIADGDSGLKIIDVANKSAPVLTGTYDSDGTSYGVYFSDDYAYIADGDKGLKIINVTDKNTPVLSDAVDTDGTAREVYLSYDYAYVADYDKGLKIINLGRDTDLTPQGGIRRIDTNGSALGVHGVGNTVYVASGVGGINAVYKDDNKFNVTLESVYDNSVLGLGVKIVGNYAYIANRDSGLRIVNISNPNVPALTGTFNTTGYSWGVDISGNYAYIADGSAGLQIVNISNPAAPSLTGTYNTSGSAYHVRVAGSYAYVADGSAGLNIVDIANPAAPVSIGSYNTPGSALGVQIVGSYAYIADGSQGLRILDVSNPAAPVSVGSYDTSGSAYGIYVSGDYAYIADDYQGLKIIDISNPASPTLTGHYDTSGRAYSLKVSGDYAYIADYTGGLKIINIRYKTAPFLVGKCTDATRVYWLDVSGDYAYLVGDPTLSVVDISNIEEAPEVSERFDIYGAFASGIDVSGNYAYVADGKIGLKLIDITDKSAPKLSIGINTEDAHAVSVSGDYACVANGDSGLKIINTTDKKRPALSGSLDTTGSAWGIVVSGNYAYLADDSNGLKIIDITNKTAPVLTGSIETDGFAVDVVVSGDYAYVIDEGCGLKIIDITNKNAPWIAGSIDTDGIAFGVSVSGDYAYVADGDSGLKIINITDKSAPVLVGSVETDGYALGVSVSGDTVYIADSSKGFKIIDVTDKSVPVILGSIDTEGNSQDIFISGDYLYLTEGSAEKLLKIFEIK